MRCLLLAACLAAATQASTYETALVLGSSPLRQALGQAWNATLSVPDVDTESTVFVVRPSPHFPDESRGDFGFDGTAYAVVVKDGADPTTAVTVTVAKEVEGGDEEVDEDVMLFSAAVSLTPFSSGEWSWAGGFAVKATKDGPKAGSGTAVCAVQSITTIACSFSLKSGQVATLTLHGDYAPPPRSFWQTWGPMSFVSAIAVLTQLFSSTLTDQQDKKRVAKKKLEIANKNKKK